MNGLEIAKGYYKEFGNPMLENEFADILPFLAVGFTGSGSEHYGFDDEISRDHDFEPGFCIFLPGEDIVDRRRAFLLERAYAKLPKEYQGVKRQQMSPVGGNRNGVIRTEEFFKDMIGSKDGTLTLEEWMTLPDYAFAEAINGEIFFDAYGEVSKIRNRLSNMPDDIRYKRIAGNLLIMAQAGQYNFVRCMKHKEPEAAQLACNEFINSTIKVVFLLQKKYAPYYKWAFRALRNLEGAKDLADKLSFILFGDNHDGRVAEKKYNMIEMIASDVITMLQDNNITKAICADLEKHAYSVNDMISDSSIRNMHILAAVGE